MPTYNGDCDCGKTTLRVECDGVSCKRQNVGAPVKQTAEWTVDDGDPRLDKLIAYAKKLGLPSPHRDSFDLRDGETRDV